MLKLFHPSLPSIIPQTTQKNASAWHRARAFKWAQRITKGQRSASQCLAQVLLQSYGSGQTYTRGSSSHLSYPAANKMICIGFKANKLQISDSDFGVKVKSVSSGSAPDTCSIDPSHEDLLLLCTSRTISSIQKHHCRLEPKGLNSSACVQGDSKPNESCAMGEGVRKGDAASV